MINFLALASTIARSSMCQFQPPLPLPPVAPALPPVPALPPAPPPPLPEFPPAPLAPPAADAPPDPPLDDEPGLGPDGLHEVANTASSETMRIVSLRPR